MYIKFHRDKFYYKSERLVCVATDAHTDTRTYGQSSFDSLLMLHIHMYYYILPKVRF